VLKWVIADPGYSSYAFREHIRSLGTRPLIPTGRTEETLLERPWARLKE